MNSVLLVVVGLGAPIRAAAGQGSGPNLFVLDLAGTPLDEFPSGVKALNGVMTVVDKNGQHMLMASSPSELLITLPQVLPAVFTVEVDLIPKGCCNPEDFMLEGTPTRNRGVASAELTWHSAHIMAVGGGGEMYQSDMPADLAASTPGNLTHLVIEVNGPTIKLWTNGRRLYTLDKQFVRGRVLRVWLGGESATNPMYLAGLRVGTGPAAPGVIASGPGNQSNPSTAGASAPASNAQALSGPSNTASGGGRVVPSVAVTQGTGGPQVTWGPLGGVTSYTVKRWKIDDLTCCTRNSPALSGPPWQDGALPIAGTYVFEVTATSPGWTATGQAQFVQFKSAGQIATVAPPSGSAPTANPAVSSGISGVKSGSAPNSAATKLLPSPPRTITVSGFSGAGGPHVAPRTVVLPAIAASGGLTSIAPSNLSVAAMTATASPRTVVLTGFVAARSSQAAVPRIVTLAGWSAVGVNP